MSDPTHPLPHFEALLELSEDLIFICELSGEVLLANRSGADALGVDAESLPGRHVSELVPPARVPDVTARLARVDTEPVQIFETEYRTADGREVPVAVRARTIEHEGRDAILIIGRDISHQQRSAAALQRSEERYRSLFDNAPVVLLELDCRDLRAGMLDLLDGDLSQLAGHLETHPETWETIQRLIRIRHVNPSAEAVLQDIMLPAEGALRVPRFSVETAQAVPRAIATATRGESTVYFETAVRLGTGQEKHYAVHLTVPPSHRQTWEQVFVAITDITQRRQVEAALEANLRDNEAMLRVLPDVIFVFSGDGTYLDFKAHRAEERTFPRSQLIGRNLRDMGLAPEPLAEFLSCIRMALDTGEPQTVEYGLDTPQGRSYWEARLVRRDEASVLAIARNITERREIEEEIRAAMEFHQSVISGALDGILVLDPGGRIIQSNKAFQSISGYSLHELLGMDLAEVLPPQRRLADLAAFRRQVNTQESRVDHETECLRRDGDSVPVLVSSSVLTNAEGATSAVVAVVRDVSELRRSQQALTEAKETAEAASQAKSEFLANMSHEIRTPMNAVVGLSGLLLDTELTAEQRDYTEKVQQSARALLSIINDILDYSKIEAGKLEFENIDFDFRSLVEDVVDILSTRAERKDLSLTCHLHADVPALLRGDPGRLRQVLFNLVGNAIKFTRQGSVRVYVTVEKEEPDAVTLLCRVMDTGIGIPADQLVDIFESFSQLDASTTRQFGGTGLGLAISKRLVENLGGRIGVESELGRGATFWFTTQLQKQPTRDLSAMPLMDLRDIRVLLLTETVPARLLLAEHMSRLGCRFGVAENRGVAVERFVEAAHNGDPYSVVIVETREASDDWETFPRQLVRSCKIAPVRVVMIASMGQIGDAARLRGVGYHAYLTKPVNGKQLAGAILALATRKPGTTATMAIVTRHSLQERLKQQLRILIAEDNPTNKLVALKILEKLGYHADAVDNGVQVLEALEQDGYDVVLMDVQMPEMDGLETTRRIRARERELRGQRIRIIAMTAYAMAGDRERCLDAGMDDYVSKPIEPVDVQQAIQRQARMRTPRAVKALRGSSPSLPKAPADAPVLDRSGLYHRLGGDVQLIRDVMATFLADAPTHVETLYQALSRHDDDEIRRIGHTLKGSAASVGAEALRAVAYQIELAGSDADLDRVPSLLTRIQEELGQLRSEIESRPLQ